MAPPGKRQKRLTVPSSDDETSNAKSTCKRIPTRSRAKAANSNNQGTCTAILSGPTSLLKSNAAKPKVAGTAQSSRPISLFFRARTQAQELDAQKISVVDKSQVEEHEDLIVEDSPIEDSDDPGERITNTTLDGKRKQPPLAYDNVASTNRTSLQGGSRRFKILEHAPNIGIARGALGMAKANAKPTLTDLRPWAEKYGPQDLEELMVHKKKVSDVRNWLDNAFRGYGCKRLLILKGPSGAGKTATVSMLAKAMGVDISEWKNPVGSEFSSEAYISMSAHLEDFLNRSGKFNQLAFADRNANASAMPSRTVDPLSKPSRETIILMEEFPNVFLTNSISLRSFRSSILRYLTFNTPSMCNYPSITPMVMIITETRLSTTTAASESFTAHRLLGPELLSHPCVSTIEFNPIASTYLTKALDLVVQKEARHSGRRRVPGLAVLKKLGEVGDIRNAIGSLEFLCLRGNDGDNWGGRVASRNKKGANNPSILTKLERDSLDIVIQRECTVGLFHAVGKVVYNKRDDFAGGDAVREPPTQPPSHLSAHGRPRVAQVSADQLMDETGTDIETFVAALHENFVWSCSGTSFTNNLDGCMEALSDSDVLGSSRGGRFGASGDHENRSCSRGAPSDALKQDEICYQVAVRGLLFALPDPVQRRMHPTSKGGVGKIDTHRMFYPTSARLSRHMEDIDSLVAQWTDRLRAGGVTVGKTRGRHSRQSTQLPSTQEVQLSKANAEDGSRPDEDAPEVFRMHLGSTRKELILERLPYVTKIEQHIGGSTLLHELEEITAFHATTPPDKEVSEDGDLREGAPANDWVIDGPAEGNHFLPSQGRSLQQGFGQANNAAGTIVLPAEAELGQLYLSDDDIEDD